MYYQHLPLYLKLVKLLQNLYRVVHNLPKEYKYSLGQDIISLNWSLLDLFILAQTSKNQTKKAIIARLSQKFECFKLRLRFLADLKLISLGQTTVINEQTALIGKMIGSWVKNVN